MKTRNILRFIKRSSHQLILVLESLFLMIYISSCTKYDEYVPVGLNAPLKLSTGNSNYILKQKGALSTIAMTFNWTTGSNMGSGTSITYELQIDKKGNNFSAPLIYNHNKASYSKSFTSESLNDTLLNYLNSEPNVAVVIESRVIAHINTMPETTDTSDVLDISVVPYLPVTKTLYMVGDATPNGWDIANASELTPDKNEPTIFTYKGGLGVGHLKFPVNRNTNWAQDMYMRDLTDISKIYLHKGGESDDNQWEITEKGLYKVIVSLCDLTIKITPLAGAEFTEMYMVGDATPNGWDISNATGMVQDNADPYIFTYNGMLLKGDFKFPVNRNTDWAQVMFMKDPDDSTKVYRHTGGASDDNKWHIYVDGWYKVRLDLRNLTISCERLKKLYIIGDASPAGWTISEAIELTSGSSGYEFIYSGALTAGDFKFPVNRNTSWTQDMFMKDPSDNSKIYFHIGGAGDDNKWTITSSQAGNYIVTLNLKYLTIVLDKQ